MRKRAILIVLLLVIATTLTMSPTVLADDNDLICVTC